MEFAEWRVKRIQRYLEENPEPPEDEEAPPCEPCCDPALAEISKLQKIVLDPDLGFKKNEPTEAELCERRMARKKRDDMKVELCRASSMLGGVRDRYVAYLERTRGPVRGFGTVPSVAGQGSAGRKSGATKSPAKTAISFPSAGTPTASRPSYPSPRLSTRSGRTAGKKSSNASGSFRVRSAAPKSTRSKASSSKSGSQSVTRSTRSAVKSGSRRSGSRQPVSTISEEMADELNNIFQEKGFTTPEREELGRRYSAKRNPAYNSKRTTSSKGSFYSKKIGDYYDNGLSLFQS